MHQMNRLSIPPQLRTTSVLVVHFLLIHFSTGQSKLIGSSQPIVATVGDDIILPCRLEPAVDVAAKTLEWTRSDLEPRFVFVWRAGQDFVTIKNPSYKGRTSLFTDELKQGNISLKLSEVKPADEGKYRCYVPDNNEESFVELVVASHAVASPAITLERINRDEEGVVLKCESKGWYPEPELLWLDAEGKILSAGPTETVRGPDELYTVSSRVTVEKRHNNKITCRVQQSNINQIRETQINILDDFFQSTASTLTAGFAVILVVCIILLILLVFFVWKWKRNKTDNKEMKNHSKTQKHGEQSEKEQLMEKGTVKVDVQDNVQEEIKTKHGKLPTVSRPKFDDKKKKREEAEKEVQTLKEQVNQLKTEVQKLKEEKQRSEDQRQQLEKELETNKPEFYKQLQAEETRREEAETLKNEVEQKITKLKDQVEAEENGRKEIEDKMEELKKKSKKLNKKEAENLKKEVDQKIKEVKKQLQSEEKKMKDNVKPLKKQLDDIDTKFKHLVQAEEQRKKEVENLKKQLENKMTECNKELQTVMQKRKDVTTSKEELDKMITELNERLQAEKEKNIKVKPLMNQLEEICKKLPAEEQNKLEDTETLKYEPEKKIPEVEPQEQNDTSQTSPSSTSATVMDHSKPTNNIPDQAATTDVNPVNSQQHNERGHPGNTTSSLPSEQKINV